MEEVKKNISVFLSFKGSADRFEVYNTNIMKMGETFCDGLPVYIDDCSGPDLREKNLQLFNKAFKNQNVMVFNSGLFFLQSWISLLNIIKTDYALAIFEDQHIFNLNDVFLKETLFFLKNEDFDVFKFDHHIFYKQENETLYLKNDDREKINKNLIKTYKTDNYKFGIVDNRDARQCYSFYANNTIYKKEKLLNQLLFYNPIYSGKLGIHMAEMNHHLCPEEYRNNKIGVVLEKNIGYVDFDFGHVAGIREVSKGAKEAYECVSKNYKIETT